MAVMKKEAMDSRSKALTLKELFKVFKEKKTTEWSQTCFALILYISILVNAY